MPKKNEAPASFETALGELEQIVNRLESGDLPLEEALSEFERGVQLARQGQSQLQKAEQRVQILLADSEDSRPRLLRRTLNKWISRNNCRPVEQANEALRRFIAPQPFQNTPLVEAMHYGALLGGKRLRPFLVYATGDVRRCRTTLDAPAAAVECIHAYSLMHDDLPAMDDDDLRRGLPTCHIKFGEANAILAGDALQTLAFSILSDAPMVDVPDRDRLAMVSELAQASGVAGMCGGQALDLQAEGQQVDLQALERIHRHKTGALIRAAVRMGSPERRRTRPRCPARAGSLCGKYRSCLPGPG